MSSRADEIFACDFDAEVEADWLPASRIGRATPSVALFEKKADDVETVKLRIHELRGSGFVTSTDSAFDVNDLLRLRDEGTDGSLLDGKVGRAVEPSKSGLQFAFQFLDVGEENRDVLLHAISRRLSPTVLQQDFGPPPKE
ncbi:MAG: hypothetical protein QGI83_24900 [Candidatus Latescibacteria bacterium]|nr:hypothetical protein [Candidatus Latescibacterota bacterium]